MTPAEEPVVTLAPAAAPPMMTVVEGPTLTRMSETVPEATMGTVSMPCVRPAGMVATAGSVVTAPGWEVMAPGRVDCAVMTLGMPVTTPREFVSVRYEVSGLT